MKQYLVHYVKANLFVQPSNTALRETSRTSVTPIVDAARMICVAHANAIKMHGTVLTGDTRIAHRVTERKIERKKR